MNATLAPLVAANATMDLLVMIAMVAAIFYFVVLRPGNKERREREAQLSALKKHDEVVTNAGIHGTVMSFDDETVVLRVDHKNNVRIKFSRQAVWQVNPAASATEASRDAS